MNFIRRYLAKRRLAKEVRKERARNASWAKHRASQLTGDRRDRFLATFEVR